MSRLIAFNKPFRVLSQFTSDGGKACLGDYIDIRSVYPAGRLDYDSEGLLLLTDDGRLQARIADPRYKLHKLYWAQVEGDVGERALAQLREGIILKDGPARALEARLIAEPSLWPRDPPIRKRAAIPTTWIALRLDEGRNRQVRRMTAAAGFPTLRLVRAQIGGVHIDSLAPGRWREVRTGELRSR